MPFHSIEPRRLYRQIADQIRGLIKSGEFPAGSRLPPERDLAKQLGVSRPSVREALIALEVEGLVEVRIGSGIYVLAPWPGAQPGLGALVHVVKLLWDERVGPLYQQLEHHYDSPELWTAAMAEHRSVLKAIAGRDPAGARAAMQRHLNQAYKRFSKGWDTLQ